MICKKCGTEYESPFCPNCGDQPKTKKKPIYKKWWFWVIIAVVVIAVASSGNSEDTSKDTGNNSISSENSNKEETTQTTTEATQATDTKYRVGDVVKANGLEITYVSAEKWESDNMFLQPEDGYMYIRIKISANNTSSTDRYISSFEFECYADGKKQSSSYVGDDTLEGGTLSTGRSTDGYIYFSVPADAEEIEVEYETSFWTNKKAIFVVELF